MITGTMEGRLEGVDKTGTREQSDWLCSTSGVGKHAAGQTSSFVGVVMV